MPYWIIITVVFMVGVWFGFFLCSLLVTAKKADEEEVI